MFSPPCIFPLTDSPFPLTPDQRLNDQRPHFRFEDREIWQLAKGLAVCFLKVADNPGKIGGEGEGRIKNNGFAVARGDVDFRILETAILLADEGRLV